MQTIEAPKLDIEWWNEVVVKKYSKWEKENNNITKAMLMYEARYKMTKLKAAPTVIVQHVTAYRGALNDIHTLLGKAKSKCKDTKLQTALDTLWKKAGAADSEAQILMQNALVLSLPKDKQAKFDKAETL